MAQCSHLLGRASRSSPSVSCARAAKVYIGASSAPANGRTSPARLPHHRGAEPGAVLTMLDGPSGERRNPTTAPVSLGNHRRAPNNAPNFDDVLIVYPSDENRTLAPDARTATGQKKRAPFLQWLRGRPCLIGGTCAAGH